MWSFVSFLAAKDLNSCRLSTDDMTLHSESDRTCKYLTVEKKIYNNLCNMFYKVAVASDATSSRTIW